MLTHCVLARQDSIDETHQDIDDAGWTLLVLDPASKGNEYRVLYLKKIRQMQNKSSETVDRAKLAREARKLLAPFRRTGGLRTN